ncbi:NAD(P)/FAD-dependent oxidoreductase [Bacillus sp. sid0103]|uniref:flavin-containing monooxygenase n=1 Tax=Bacillus sp. sid0103 TaxID=2856337 RepID=UPI001C47E1ED|nr:NAD(P)/FAD-dependent oxidoreductase [Bacillus sp. sid0103]MBV7507665.1 NAD(P)/FAD-dependent oxidoreductase [Bacillus sp. sid0103]
MLYDVVVIGGGQAGLSIGYYLKQTSLSFIILDNQKAVGDAWRKRYDSLVLFTPRAYSSLPGLALNGDPSGFPTKDEIADYLEHYPETFDLPIHHSHVQKVQEENQLFTITTNDSLIKTKKIVVATGPFHTPRIPSFAKELPTEMVQLHSSQYKNHTQLKDGAVLVVGAGNSGTQIAVELSEHHETYLSIGQKIRFLPLTVAGRSIFWCFDKLGILKADRNSWIGKKIQSQADPIFGYYLKEKLKKKRVTLKGRTISINKDEIHFEDQSSVKVENIIWATGFLPNYSWIDIPHLFDDHGHVKHNRGVTEIEGLYFLGLPWQQRRGSALLFGVGDDAEFLYQHISNLQE